MNIRRNIRRHRRSLGGVTLLLGIVILFAVVCSPLAVRAAVANKQLPIYCVQRDDKCVSLTFDAAWGDVILRHTALGYQLILKFKL